MGSAEPESGNRSMIPRWNMGAWTIEKGIGTLPVEVSVGFFVIPSWNLSATAIVICQWLRDCMKWIMFCWVVDLKCAVMRWASFKPRRRGHEASPSEEEPVLRIEDQRFGGLGLQSPRNELHDQLKISHSNTNPTWWTLSMVQRFQDDETQPGMVCPPFTLAINSSLPRIQQYVNNILIIISYSRSSWKVKVHRVSWDEFSLTWHEASDYLERWLLTRKSLKEGHIKTKYQLLSFSRFNNLVWYKEMFP